MFNRDISLGEKIEAIIHARQDLSFGTYRGSSAETFGACSIDGVVYKVKRNIEVNAGPYWTVTNINTAEVKTIEDRYDIGCISEKDFSENPFEVEV